MAKKSILFALVFCLFLTGLANAQKRRGFPADISGELKGAPFRIVVPENWNGTLLVYAHGYRDKADHPGEVDNRNADVAPNAAFEPVLLGQGYALAGTAYKDNGWAVEEGIHDLKNLVTHFRGRIANPQKVIIWGFSMGTVIAFESMEKFPDIYDGALCGCAVGAGATQSWDSAGDLTLAYDTVFGMPAMWGNPGDVRDDIDFETEVGAKLFPELQNPANFPKFEFMRLVTGTPGRGIVPPAPPAFYPNWVITDMFFATEARSELERRARGAVTQNLDRNYDLTVAERGYLNSLGVPNSVIDSWLLQMNNGRIYSPPNRSRNYLKRNANYTGEIEKPVLTVHTLVDPLVAVSQEREYLETVTNAGRTQYLYQAYTNGNGHCNFTPQQLQASLFAITNWVENGIPPTPANFPTALGFLPSTFVPPPMIQP
jgi:pimeloyl-ACP methyl ester carboxylesterase